MILKVALAAALLYTGAGRVTAVTDEPGAALAVSACLLLAGIALLGYSVGAMFGRCAREGHSSSSHKHALLVAVAAAAAASAYRLSAAPAHASEHDGPTWFERGSGTAPYGARLESRYVRMSDGVRLAVDVYSPSPAPGGPADTVYLHMTRYNRRVRVRFPASLALGATLNVRSGAYVREFVRRRGYTVVTADVRGTGASYGSRPIDMHEREQLDLAELVAYVRAQPFCRAGACRVFSGGISYDALTGLLAASRSPPGAVDGVDVVFSPVDAYEHLLYPGGLPCSGFVRDYARFAHAAEQDHPVSGVPMTPLTYAVLSAFDGVAGVEGEPESARDGAVRAHAENYDMMGVFSAAWLRDDVVAAPNLTLGDAGVRGRDIEALAARGTRVNVYAGYYDSGSVRSAVRLLERLPGRARAVIGPWTHGLRNPSAFPLVEDMARFHAGAGGEDDAAGARFFVMGPAAAGGGWRRAASFPPPGAEDRTLYLDPPRLALAAERPAPGSSARFEVPYATTSGVQSRWNLVQAVLRQPVVYREGDGVDLRGAVEFSAVLPGATVLAGGARLELVFAEPLASADATVFAYLFDGERYVTEGQVRAKHGAAPGAGGRSFASGDLLDRPPARLRLDLEPVAYAFAAGSRARLLLAGADTDNFRQPPASTLPSHWVLSGESSIVLPVI